MPVYPLLYGQAFGPELIDAMAKALEDSLRALRLTDRKDPLTEIIAKRIIRLAQTGERDPQRMRERVLQALGHVSRREADRDAGLPSHRQAAPKTCAGGC